MRRIAAFGGFLVLACAVATLATIVWVDRALAAAKDSPNSLCLTARDRDKIAAGHFPSNRRDTFVAKAINFHQGVPKSMLWWHGREAAIQLTYVTFWSPSRRADEFNRLVSRMRDCSPQSEGRASA
jgi:hypothetical protein